MTLSFAQTPPLPTGPTSDGTLNHDQMHQMLDDMHGDGNSQRMHEMMGTDADMMIDHLLAMHGMMQQMQAMMDDGRMAAIPDDQRQMMQDMMSMMESMSPMMLQMMGMMSSGTMPMDMMRGHQIMMQQMLDMMQQMIEMMSSGMMATE